MNQSLSEKQPVSLKLPDSIRYIIQNLESKRTLKPAQVRRVILDAKVQPEDLLPWADFDHPIQDSYGRKMIYKGDNFEVMAMSWRPGDVSTIHDHGYTQWGCVQVFGPAEHATFRIEDDQVKTLSREVMKPYQAIGVSHSLLHQMGNTTKDAQYQTLHVYGDIEDVDSVTGDARVLDLENDTIQRVDGGVFFALPVDEVVRIEEGPKGDFPTRLRHMIELIRRLNKMEAKGLNRSDKKLPDLLDDFYGGGNKASLLASLEHCTDENGKVLDSIHWRILNWELREAAKLHIELKGHLKSEDRIALFTSIYDHVSGQPMLDTFKANYLRHFIDQHITDIANQEILSIGCGTGLVEQFMIDELGASKEKVYGIDLSEDMVETASKRIRADVGDVLTLDPTIKTWDIAYLGGRVLHFVGNDRLKEGIEKTAAVIKPGGYFIGDFITPDHIRSIPNVAYSAENKVISLRDHELVEEGGAVFMSSKVLNVSFLDGQMQVVDDGLIKHFLPSLSRVRSYFEAAFGGEVTLLDAVSLEPISEWADTCPSTRYLVIAKKE